MGHLSRSPVRRLLSAWLMLCFGLSLLEAALPDELSAAEIVAATVHAVTPDDGAQTGHGHHDDAGHTGEGPHVCHCQHAHDRAMPREVALPESLPSRDVTLVDRQLPMAAVEPEPSFRPPIV